MVTLQRMSKSDQHYQESFGKTGCIRQEHHGTNRSAGRRAVRHRGRAHRRIGHHTKMIERRMDHAGRVEKRLYDQEMENHGNGQEYHHAGKIMTPCDQAALRRRLVGLLRSRHGILPCSH